jgi:hypothetical protein
MAWWLTVYCRSSVASLDAQQLADGLRDRDPEAPAGVDYAALAEEYEIDEDDMNDALARLSVVAVSQKPLDVEIHYGPDARPIVVHLWNEPARVAEELEETHDGREPPDGALPYLSACREVVGIELGYSQLDDMGLVLACELARYLAQKGDGIFVDDNNEWYAVEDGEFTDP